MFETPDLDSGEKQVPKMFDRVQCSAASVKSLQSLIRNSDMMQFLDDSSSPEAGFAAGQAKCSCHSLKTSTGRLKPECSLQGVWSWPSASLRTGRLQLDIVSSLGH